MIFTAPWSGAGGLPGRSIHRVGDFNGDGLDDLASYADGNWWVSRSTGVVL